LINYYIFGLQRTGTVFLTDIIDFNYWGWVPCNMEAADVANWQKPWKHLIDVTVTKEKFRTDIPIIVVSKHPYTWLESIIYREPIDFFETQPYNEYCERHPNGYIEKGLNVQALAAMYNDFYSHWVFQEHDWIDYSKMWLIRWEILLYDDIAGPHFRAMMDYFGAVPSPRREKAINNIPLDEMYMFRNGGSKSQWASPNFYDDVDYYKQQKPRQLPVEAVESAKVVLNKYLLIKLGYGL